jgi:decaprenylphospho-beta-D-erythro-pentofuranosid-2-ulose 2-reductase
MKDKWILILGANSDIAKATAERFAKSGCSLILASRNLSELRNEAANLEIRYDTNIKVLYFDATDFESHFNFYKSLLPSPDGVIMAFGLMNQQNSEQDNFDLAKLTIDTNYISAVSILEIVASDFQKRKYGFIVGISSVAGDRGRQSNYIYGSSKAGLSAYLEGLRGRLYESNVELLIVKPGFVETKMTEGMKFPVGLATNPKTIANAIHNGVLKKKNTIYVKTLWRFIMLIIQLIPDSIFKKLKL